ncbi:hypothetical protein BGX23_007726 [Mortierella sp. AD031]|nr:hypothetical protein BGX23_007726 [Mortierella sp. AD031]
MDVGYSGILNKNELIGLTIRYGSNTASMRDRRVNFLRDLQSPITPKVFGAFCHKFGFFNRGATNASLRRTLTNCYGTRFTHMRHKIQTRQWIEWDKVYFKELESNRKDIAFHHLHHHHRLHPTAMTRLNRNLDHTGSQ